jgi:hypothetical protein
MNKPKINHNGTRAEVSLMNNGKGVILEYRQHGEHVFDEIELTESFADFSKKSIARQIEASPYELDGYDWTTDESANQLLAEYAEFAVEAHAEIYGA